MLWLTMPPSTCDLNQCMFSLAHLSRMHNTVAPPSQYYTRGLRTTRNIPPRILAPEKLGAAMRERRLLCLQRLPGGLCGRAIRGAVPVSLPFKSGAAAAPEGGTGGGGVGYFGPAPSPEGVSAHCHCCWLGGTGLPSCHPVCCACTHVPLVWPTCAIAFAEMPCCQ